MPEKNIEPGVPAWRSSAAALRLRQLVVHGRTLRAKGVADFLRAAWANAVDLSVAAAFGLHTAEHRTALEAIAPPVPSDRDDDFPQRLLKQLGMLEEFAHRLEKTPAAAEVPGSDARDRPRNRKPGMLEEWVRRTQLKAKAETAVKVENLDAETLMQQDFSLGIGPLGIALVHLDPDAVAHPAVIAELELTVRNLVRGHGTSYTEASNEIVMLLPNFSEAMGVAFAQAVRAQVKSTEFWGHGGEAPPLTVSLGVTWCDRATGLEATRASAREATRVSRSTGGDRVTIGAPPSVVT
jgi:hypothetical protein